MTSPIILSVHSKTENDLTRAEKRLKKQERKQQHQASQAAIVRVVNTSEDYPHVVQRQSVWYIANPKNGTQFVKAKSQRNEMKPIYNQHGKVTGQVPKVRTTTSLAMKVIETATSEQKLLFPTIVKVDSEGRPVKKTGINEDELIGFDKLTWPMPKGFTPVIVKNSNYVDLPPDAANLIFNGEYRGPNPLTQQHDLRYHNGHLVPLSAAHDMADAIYSGKSEALDDLETKRRELAAENARLESAIRAKTNELDAANVAELVEKRNKVAKGGSTTPDSPNKPSA